MARALITVVETAAFIAAAARLLSENERAGVIEMLARNPECGDVIPGTGGLRFYLNEGIPLLVLMVYAKNQTAQLSKAQERELAAIASSVKKAKKERT